MAKPACILFLLDWRPVFWSTREEYFRRLSHELVSRGVAPVITVSAEVEPEVRRRFEESGAVLLVQAYGMDRLGYWRHIRDVARRYEVLLAQVRFFDYFALTHWMCRLSGIRNIVFTEANSGEWRGASWKMGLIRLRTILTCYPLSRVIAISRFIQQRLIATGIPEENTRLVYNGIDTETFAPDPKDREDLRAEINARPDDFLITYASSMLAWKRPEVALGVCRRLVSEGVRVKLLMAGMGPIRSSLQSQAESAGIAAHVRWLGHYPHPHRLLSGSDVFLHTSLGEAFGNVLAEAMACGTPVVATDSGGTPEVVANGETGILVRAGHDEVLQLTDAIKRLARDPLLRRRMSEAAVQRARSLFSIDVAVRNSLAVYRELLGRRLAPDVVRESVKA